MAHCSGECAKQHSGVRGGDGHTAAVFNRGQFAPACAPLLLANAELLERWPRVHGNHLPVQVGSDVSQGND